MYGAIIGDIIGSRFEFGRIEKTKDFDLFHIDDNFTDDTVMTIAVCEALLTVGRDASTDEIEAAVKSSMQSWAHKYPDAGYGAGFVKWINLGDKATGYNSYGNGSSMRVSAAGWLYDSLERTREVARATANVSHNHPEGIKGAEATAAAIFMARNNVTKAEIKAYIEKEFGYDLSRPLDSFRESYTRVQDSMHSVPESIICFLEGSDYEDTVRNAVSLGGDTDTMAAIAGSIAEAFYGIPFSIMARGMAFIPDDIMAVISAFDMVLGRTSAEPAPEQGIPDQQHAGNQIIKAAALAYSQEKTEDALGRLLNALAIQAISEQCAPTPMVAVDGDENKLRIDNMRDGSGDMWLPLFTENAQVTKGKTSDIVVEMPIINILRVGYRDTTVKGIVINPFDNPVMVSKEMIGAILSHITNM